MWEKETAPPENAPAEAAADVAPAIKSLAECCELNQAGVDVTEDIAHYLREATDEYGQLGSECADLYFLYGDNMLRLAQVLGKNKFKEELRLKRDARDARSEGASAATASATAPPAVKPDLQEVNELVGAMH